MSQGQSLLPIPEVSALWIDHQSVDVPKGNEAVYFLAPHPIICLEMAIDAFNDVGHLSDSLVSGTPDQSLIDCKEDTVVYANASIRAPGMIVWQP